MRILIVDDEYSNRKNIRILIESLQYPVDEFLEAANGQEAIALLEKNPHVVITDMKMPVKDGTSVLDYIEASHKKCAILVVSGYSDFIYTKRAIRSKVIDYLLKPVKEEEFASAFALAVAAGCPESIEERRMQTGFKMRALVQNGLSRNDFMSQTQRIYPVFFHFVNFEDIKQKNYSQMGDLLLYRLECLLREAWEIDSNLAFRNVVNRQDIALMVEGVMAGEEVSMTKADIGKILEKIYQKSGIMTHAIMASRLATLDELPGLLMKAIRWFNSLDVVDGFPVYDLELTSKSEEEGLQDADKWREMGGSLGEILLYIQDHYFEKIDLDFLSKEFFLSKSYISRIFKQKLGVNFITYLTDYRLARAKELLEQTNYKVYYISEQVGFSDYSYFCTVFKKAFEMSPSEYRANTVLRHK